MSKPLPQRIVPRRCILLGHAWGLQTYGHWHCERKGCHAATDYTMLADQYGRVGTPGRYTTRWYRAKPWVG